MTKGTFDSLVQKWPSSFVARHEVDRFSGGMLHGRTLANLDSQGLGPRGRVKIGNRVAYSVQGLVEFLEAKISG